MSVAECLGLAGPESWLLDEARAAWPRWCAADPELAVAGDLRDLSAWTRLVNDGEKNAVIASLAALTATEPAAVTALAWLLLPGATALAHDLGDLDPDIDRLVAGQLWIEIAGAHHVRGGRVAATILRRTRREVCADLGVGDGAARRDRAWANSVRGVRFDETAAAGSCEDEVDPFLQVTELLIDAMDDGVIEVFDAWLIGELARVAHHCEAPGHRGRMGLTTPAVVETVAQHVHLSTRGLRRRAVKAVDRIADYLTVRDDPARFALWSARHPAEALTVPAQMQLVITEDESAYWVRSRSRAVEESVREGPSGSRRSESA